MSWKGYIASALKKRRSTAKILALHDMSKQTSYLERVGWFDSFQQSMAVDRQLVPIPWLTYPAIAFIEQRLRKKMALFEYGSGNSTIWWATHVARVVSCEHDAVWHEKMIPNLPANVDYMHVPLADGYCDAIKHYTGEFDVVVIDGRDRVACARNSLAALKSSGVIVWDNSEREKYNPGYDILCDAGFRRLDFWGNGPIIPDIWCTSVFYRETNCFEI